MKTKSFILRRSRFIAAQQLLYRRVAAFISGAAASSAACGHFSCGVAALLLLFPLAALADETPDLLVCANKGYALKPADNKVAAGTNLVYTWYEKTNTGEYAEVNGQFTESLSVSAESKTAGTYSYVRTVTGENCSEELPSNTYTVVVLNPAVPEITVPSNVCQGVDDLVFSASGDAGSTFTWSGSNTPSGAGDGTYTVLKSSAAQTYSLQATANVYYEINALNKTCTSGSSTVAQAAINPLPTVTQTGTTAWCGSASQVLQVTAQVGSETDGITVKWYDNANGTGDALAESTTSYTVEASNDPNDVKKYAYYVRATVGATGCVNPTPLTEITGTRNLYEGEITGEVSD